MNDLRSTNEERIDTLERKIADLQMISALSFYLLAGDNADLKEDFIERLRDTADALEADDFRPSSESGGACREVAAQLARYF